MPTGVLLEENKRYQFDFSTAISYTNELNNVFKLTDSALSDVDFVVETENEILLVEYKNASLPDASNPNAFNPSEQRQLLKIAYKFYDSIIYLNACDFKKPFHYIYILEYPKGDSTTRKAIRNKIMNYLPFRLQNNDRVKKLQIKDFDVLSISEWNNDPFFSKFPITKVIS